MRAVSHISRSPRYTISPLLYTDAMFDDAGNIEKHYEFEHNPSHAIRTPDDIVTPATAVHTPCLPPPDAPPCALTAVHGGCDRPHDACAAARSLRRNEFAASPRSRLLLSDIFARGCLTRATFHSLPEFFRAHTDIIPCRTPSQETRTAVFNRTAPDSSSDTI